MLWLIQKKFKEYVETLNDVQSKLNSDQSGYSRRYYNEICKKDGYELPIPLRDFEETEILKNKKTYNVFVGFGMDNNGEPPIITTENEVVSMYIRGVSNNIKTNWIKGNELYFAIEQFNPGYWYIYIVYPASLERPSKIQDISVFGMNITSEFQIAKKTIFVYGLEYNVLYSKNLEVDKGVKEILVTV